MFMRKFSQEHGGSCYIHKVGNKFGYFKSYVYICSVILDISIVIWTYMRRQMTLLCGRLVLS